MKEQTIYDLLKQIEDEISRDTYHLTYDDQLAISTKVAALKADIKSIYDQRTGRTSSNGPSTLD